MKIVKLCLVKLLVEFNIAERQLPINMHNIQNKTKIKPF